VKIYTDGSKTADGVGAAAVAGGLVQTASLPHEASIFSAELHAIYMATCIIEDSRSESFTIFSDSYSALLNLNKFRLNHPVVLIIKHRLHKLIDNGKTVHLCWIPGHVGINGNEKADTEAKRAGKRCVQAVNVFYKDFYPVIEEKMKSKWNLLWQNSGDKLLQIKSDVKEWKVEKGKTRREEVVLNRVRLGHTNITHNYLMDGNNQMAPICVVCGDERLTVAHIFVGCRELRQERERFITVCRENPVPNLRSLLGEGANIKEIINYLIHIRVFEKI